jgi:hypothetical protein
MNTVTTIVPIGDFTPGLSRRVRETAHANAQEREVIISMQSTQRCSWSALYDLAESLRAAVTPYPIRLARTVPRTRALLRELGIQSGWFVDDAKVRSDARIFILENGARLAMCMARPRDSLRTPRRVKSLKR